MLVLGAGDADGLPTSLRDSVLMRGLATPTGFASSFTSVVFLGSMGRWETGGGGREDGSVLSCEDLGWVSTETFGAFAVTELLDSEGSPQPVPPQALLLPLVRGAFADESFAFVASCPQPLLSPQEDATFFPQSDSASASLPPQPVDLLDAAASASTPHPLLSGSTSFDVLLLLLSFPQASSASVEVVLTGTVDVAPHPDVFQPESAALVEL